MPIDVRVTFISIGSSDFLSQRFLGQGDDFLIRFLVLNVDWYHTHAENLTRANYCTLGITDIGTITLDYVLCLITIAS